MTPQEEKELLLRVVVRVATQQLELGRGFYPFGAILGANRDVQLLMPQSMKTDVREDELKSYWVRELRKAIEQGRATFKTACYCTDVRITLETSELVPAISAHIEHANADAETITYPYCWSHDAKPLLNEPTRSPAEHLVFSVG